MRVDKRFRNPLEATPMISTITEGGRTDFLIAAKDMVRSNHSQFLRELKSFRALADGERGILSLEIGGGREPGTHDLGFLTESDIAKVEIDEDETEAEKKSREHLGEVFREFDESKDYILQIINGQEVVVFRVSIEVK